jgi:Short C-terminal domain
MPTEEGNRETTTGQKVWDWLLGEPREVQAEREPSVWDSLTGDSPEKRQERQLTKTQGYLVGLACKEALDQAAVHLTREGASITNRSDNSISFTYRKPANALVFIILLCLFIVPAIIYAFIGGGRVHFTLTATPAPGGCRLLFGGEYGAGYNEFRRWLKNAPAPNPAITHPKVSGPLQEEGDSHTDVPTQIQKLAELHDTEVLTEEEFQTKKRDLLDRM